MSLLAISFWIHLIGISIWVGASLLLPLVIQPAIMSLEPPSRMKPLAAISQRLTPLVTLAIVLTFLSGLVQTFLRYGGFGIFMSVNTLSLKVFVAVLMMINGFYLSVFLARRIGTLAPAPGAPPSPEFLKAQRLLRMHSWIQAGMAVIVLLLVGILTAR